MERVVASVEDSPTNHNVCMTTILKTLKENPRASAGEIVSQIDDRTRLFLEEEYRLAKEHGLESGQESHGWFLKPLRELHAQGYFKIVNGVTRLTTQSHDHLQRHDVESGQGQSYRPYHPDIIW
jgi:hypothetical protein